MASVPNFSPDQASARAADAAHAVARTEVAAGLSRSQKEISPRWFYDERGSELFERITRLPEYYLFREERALLREFVPGWIREMRPAALVELGAGAATKTRILLDAFDGATDGAWYIPVDISEDFLKRAADSLREEYPALEIRPLVADFTRPLPLPDALPRPAVFALLGSTIGNFGPRAAVELLTRIASRMREGDRFLLGTDLHKDRSVLEAAYNDQDGVTAAFNLNALAVLNRELGTDFDPRAFRHRAFYDGGTRRIEMHLVAVRDLTVTVPGAGRFTIAAGETIRTEISCKYDRARVAEMFGEAGLILDDWVTGGGPEPPFALAVGRTAALGRAAD